jgi:hypothetical protein
MSCPYFREGYVGVCIAFELIFIPSIARMETYCFNEHYGLCPSLASYMSEPSEESNLKASKEAPLQRRGIAP